MRTNKETLPLGQACNQIPIVGRDEQPTPSRNSSRSFYAWTKGGGNVDSTLLPDPAIIDGVT
jgi:hypothetical protein